MSVKVNCLLLVDDENEEVRKTSVLIKKTKLDVGQIVVATSLAQAITTIVDNKEIDLIFLDLNLEDSKALDTLAAIRSVSDAVIIVLLDTEDKDEILGIDSLKSGADDFIFKKDICEDCLRQSIVKSMTMHNIRKVASKIQKKVETLLKVVTVGAPNNG